MTHGRSDDTDDTASMPTIQATEKERHPKQIILRLRVNEFISCHPAEFDRAIMAYLESVGRPPDELTKRLHQSHIEPFQDPSMKQRSFHIVLDLEKDMISDPDIETVEHEVHRVRRTQDGSFLVNRFQNPEEKVFITKMRRFTDTFYPWAS